MDTAQCLLHISARHTMLAHISYCSFKMGCKLRWFKLQRRITLSQTESFSADSAESSAKFSAEVLGRLLGKVITVERSFQTSKLSPQANVLCVNNGLCQCTLKMCFSSMVSSNVLCRQCAFHRFNVEERRDAQLWKEDQGNCSTSYGGWFLSRCTRASKMRPRSNAIRALCVISCTVCVCQLHCVSSVACNAGSLHCDRATSWSGTPLLQAPSRIWRAHTLTL